MSGRTRGTRKSQNVECCLVAIRIFVYYNTCAIRVLFVLSNVERILDLPVLLTKDLEEAPDADTTQNWNG